MAVTGETGVGGVMGVDVVGVVGVDGGVEPVLFPITLVDCFIVATEEAATLDFFLRLILPCW